MRITLAIVGIFLAFPPQRTAVPMSQANDLRIGALLEPIRVRHRLPALGGAIVTSQGLTALAVTGVRKAGTDVAATPSDLWHLGSDTKAMTAVVIARLVERGLLTWETTIESVAPRQVRSAPAVFRGITLLQLLSHRAGLAPNLEWARMAAAAPTPSAQRLVALERAAEVALLSTPGSKYEYSNLGYVIAATMAEIVAKQPWEQMIRDGVFTPLKMTSAGFGGVGTAGQIDQPWPHFNNGQPTPSNGPDVDNPPVMGPAGTVHCTLADWAAFITETLRGFKGEGTLLTPATYARLHEVPFGGDYAFGWLVTRRPWGGGSGIVYTHAGSNTMNYCVVWISPAKDFAVLAVSNQGGPEAQAGTDAVAAALIGMAGLVR